MAVIALLALAGGGGAPVIRAATAAPEVAPLEDLMREHGLLSRVLLIYDEVRRRLDSGAAVPENVVPRAAGIVRQFVEDYHEKLEEQYIFPRFRKADVLRELADTLQQQHNAGRRVTDRILDRAAQPGNRQELGRELAAFTAMYRAHKAREDTVLFPAFHDLVSEKEYRVLGETFEDREHRLFGEDGFTAKVRQVAELERELGIGDLPSLTPRP
jgi:hemerythrin-like domain-containing protein